MIDRTEVEDPSNNVPGGDCCSSSEHQIWWYHRYNSKLFGIHLDLAAHESFHGKGTKVSIKSYFHEFFHHIVDSWTIGAEIETEELNQNYQSQILKERRGGPQLLIEEAMATYFGLVYPSGFNEETKDLCYHKMRHGPFSDSYDLWPGYAPFGNGDHKWNEKDWVNEEAWHHSSMIVAVQYISGNYSIEGLTSVSNDFDRPWAYVGLNNNFQEWDIPMVSTFRSKGFACEGRGGFTLDGALNRPHDIPFYIHNLNREEGGKLRLIEHLLDLRTVHPIYL